ADMTDQENVFLFHETVEEGTIEYDNGRRGRRKKINALHYTHIVFCECCSFSSLFRDLYFRPVLDPRNMGFARYLNHSGEVSVEGKDAIDVEFLEWIRVGGRIDRELWKFETDSSEFEIVNRNLEFLSSELLSPYTEIALRHDNYQREGTNLVCEGDNCQIFVNGVVRVIMRVDHEQHISVASDSVEGHILGEMRFEWIQPESLH
ncbi:hypothetical protein PENTCL1PPCAC_17301, partial [Pristionchus entomophagus]